MENRKTAKIYVEGQTTEWDKVEGTQITSNI